MGIFDALIEGGINAMTGGSASGGSSDGNIAAYKGDGVYGLGTFLSGLAAGYGTITVKDNQNTDRLKDYVRTWLDASTDYLRHKYNNDSYDMCDAIKAADIAVKDHFYEYKTNIPELLVDCQYGIYNSTSTQLIANDAYARTIAKTSALRLQAIKDFRELQIAGDALPLNAFGRQIESWTAFEQNRTEKRRPDMSAFAEDAAKMMVAITILSIFTNRKYKTDDSTGGLL